MFDLLNVVLKVEWCLCYFVICCSMVTGTPSLNISGHQKAIGKGNMLVINFNKRKSSIIFPEFGYFLEKTERKTFRLKKYGFSSAFQEFTFYKLKLREQEMCFVS